MGSMMMPSCYPKKKFNLKDSKLDLNEVFSADDDTPLSSVWTASENTSRYHTPQGSTTPELKCKAPEGICIEGVTYSIWDVPETKAIIPQLAVHGSVSKVTQTKLSYCDPTRFKLRVGPNYPVNRKKGPSPPALYNLRAVDMLSHSYKIKHISRFFDRSKTKLNPEEDVMEGDIINGIPRFFIVTYMLPSYSPSMSLFNPVTDGPGFTVVFFFVLSKRGLEASIKKTGAYRVLRRFCSPDCDMPDKKRGPNLWKNVVSVANFKDIGLNYYLTKYIKNYNAKPWLSRSPDMHKFKGRDYYEVDVDIHVYNYIGLRFMYELKGSLNKLIVDVGFVVQSEKDDEMPETLLGGGRLSHINYENDCVPVDWDKYDEAERAEQKQG
eukprot:CAMPEP_0184493300 /NCGR_PEP_ID=MMETSP0113_2-20130426/25631_1 /TAXON_ID=91329 /ORGANISM="Norrisiella sphaerica, Strain BC52" /LENGTH=379 /DNA_ID=CAMNT_0026878511 /DNA_START=170 /DNA_END=1309 /DNA_ORIENTATION=+